jgi:hypothetical protein
MKRETRSPDQVFGLRPLHSFDFNAERFDIARL